jgi:hypothetical protein
MANFYLFIKTLCFIVLYDLRWRRWPFERVIGMVADWPVSSTMCLASEETSHRIDLVFAWYPKKTLCLHRSVVATCILRDCGVRAELVVGSKQMPFSSHAWVEVNGRVINDRASVKAQYQTLCRC